MRSLQRIFALLTLLGWLFAAGHVAWEHAGVADGGVKHAVLGCKDGADHEDDGPAQDGEHHQHHDLTVSVSGQWMKSAERGAFVPVCISLFDVLAEQFADMLHEPRLLQMRRYVPPDERTSGWLLVCRTAHPVRGPSLAV